MMNDTTFSGNGKVSYIPVITGANPKPITNADRIRAMTDEEMARWIATTADDNCPDTAHERYCDNRCVECWLDWLKAAVEEVGK